MIVRSDLNRQSAESAQGSGTGPSRAVYLARSLVIGRLQSRRVTCGVQAATELELDPSVPCKLVLGLVFVEKVITFRRQEASLPTPLASNSTLAETM